MHIALASETTRHNEGVYSTPFGVPYLVLEIYCNYYFVSLSVLGINLPYIVVTLTNMLL